MRLIDADKNREDFKKIVYCILKDDFSTSKVKFNKIMTAFDSMPTAYSVDKVVEELEEVHNKFCKNVVCGGKSNRELCEICEEYAMFKKNIEIVKQGGVNDN